MKREDKQDIQNKIIERYEKFFVIGDKITSESGKKISFIDYDLFEEFFETLSTDNDVPEEIKIGACLFATGGNRFQEAANIRRKDLSTYKGMLIFETDVLKKKHIIKYETLINERIKRLEYDKTDSEIIDCYKDVMNLWMKFVKRTPYSTVKEEFSSRYEETSEDFIDGYNGLQEILRDNHRVSTAKALSELKELKGVTLRNDQVKSLVKFIKESNNSFSGADLHSYLVVIKNFYRKNYEKLRKLDTPRRECVVVPCMENIIKERISKCKHQEFLLKRNQRYYLRWFKKHFGDLFTIHSFRHSFVSYLLFNKKMTDIEVAHMLEMTVDNIRSYAKYKRKEELVNIYRR